MSCVSKLSNLAFIFFSLEVEDIFLDFYFSSDGKIGFCLVCKAFLSTFFFLDHIFLFSFFTAITFFFMGFSVVKFDVVASRRYNFICLEATFIQVIIFVRNLVVEPRSRFDPPVCVTAMRSTHTRL